MPSLSDNRADRESIFDRFEVDKFSLVAKRPSPRHVNNIRAVLPQGVQIYLSADPHSPVNLLPEGTEKLVTSGFRPVPHLAVRMFADEDELDGFIQSLSKAGANQLFVIGGDVERPAGVLKSSLELLTGPLLHKHGVVEVGIAGYPEGHPQLPDEVLEISLAQKIRAAEEGGIRIHIATQFCFHAESISKWINSLREQGFRNRIKVGIPGPSEVSTLLSYATTCGVVTSAAQLQREAIGTEKREWTPNYLLEQLAEEFSKYDPGEVV